MNYPNWKKFTPDFARAELERLLPLAEKGVADVEASSPGNFAQLVHPLNDAVSPLWRVWGGISHELSVMNSADWRRLQEDWQTKIVTFSLRVGQSLPVYEKAKTLLAKANLKPVERRILEKMCEGAELAGVALKGRKKDRFNAIQAQIAQLMNDFSNEVIDTTPADIADAKYVETMKHEKSAAVRKRIYLKRATRAPKNEARIPELLKLRAECARLLGFRTFAELSLAPKCAPDVPAVMKMIDDLDAATKRQAAAEDAELASFAKRKLAPWDYTYFAERLREAKYSYSEDELKKNFEFEKVLKGLWKLCGFLFRIDVKELRGKAKPSVWHPDVRFFEVSEKGRVVAHFYLDPYVRPGLKSGGAWMNEFVNRSKRRHEQPLAVVVLNQQKPEKKDEKCLMTFREVETLFHEFGHACQQMLTQITEEDAAGINNVEWDAVEVASQFMENWCLDDRTGIKVPEELKRKVRAAKNFRAASACRRQLAFAKTDMILHGRKLTESPNAIKEKVFGHFDYPLVPEDRFLNAFTHIFSGGYSAGYYGYKWSEVMSADCYGAFEEAGLADDTQVQKLGMRYRRTVLGLGGSKNALEVFRDFRGRAPTIDAILRQQGLKS